MWGCEVALQLTFGSLFAGIGGFDLGFERAGMRCVWQVEIDPFCQRVLAKHWPNVRRWDDVRTFPPEPTEDWTCDVICGGFPCQDVSLAGNRAGLAGRRSGLWSEIVRCVRVVRPRFVVVENVAALLGNGMGRVLGDLAAVGYDAEWVCLPASAFGAWHHRDRVFVISQPADVRDADRFSAELVTSNGLGEFTAASSSWWESEPGMGRVADGFPGRVDRLRGLGNAVVPQVAQWIGERLMEATRGNS